MKAPARMLRYVGEAEYRDAAEPLLAAAGDAALVRRGLPRSLLIACPDGCGETLVINLDRRAGKAWRIDTRGEGLTLYPSVWREGGCGSHFIVWRGRIIWCDRYTERNREPHYDAQLEPIVLDAMDAVVPRSAEMMADSIDGLVWDVDRAARRLVDRDLARSWKTSREWGFVRK